MLASKMMTLRPEQYEKVARLGRISNVVGLREHEMRSNPWYYLNLIPPPQVALPFTLRHIISPPAVVLPFTSPFI